MHNSKEIISRNIYALRELLDKFSDDEKNKIITIASVFVKTINSGGCIFWCGNGGSASDSQHLSAELIGRFKKNRIPFKSLSLNSDTAAITCISNDFGYENLFSRQLEALGNKGDLLVVLSTSGNSKNIEKVLEKAKIKQIQTIALLGLSLIHI